MFLTNTELWGMTLSSLVVDYQRLGQTYILHFLSTLLQYFGKLVTDYTASHLRRQCSFILTAVRISYHIYYQQRRGGLRHPWREGLFGQGDTETYRILKFVMGSFGLGSLLLTESGSMLWALGITSLKILGGDFRIPWEWYPTGYLRYGILPIYFLSCVFWPYLQIPD